MKNQRIDVASIRREQIVEAAVAVIAEKGLQNLSLSEIEKKAGMSRGQLTYYFPAKEDILLAVFDRLLLLMYQRIGTPEGRSCDQLSGWDWVRHLLQKTLPAWGYEVVSHPAGSYPYSNYSVGFPHVTGPPSNVLRTRFVQAAGALGPTPH